MPQLNPAPWFLILIFSWLVFLFIIPSKILKHTFNNEPETANSQKPKTDTWYWTWH